MNLLRTTLLLSIATTLFVNEAQSQARNVIHAAKGSVQIDGKIDEVWKTTQAVLTEQLVTSELKTTPGSASMGRFRFLWDEHHLYLLAEVRDQKIATDSGNSWEHDSIEVFLDENKRRSIGIQPDDSQYRVSAVGRITSGNYGLGKNVQAVTGKTKDGYQIEMAIKLHSSPNKNNRQLGIEFQVNNNDGTGKRVSVAKWNHAENDAWRSTANYGTIHLVNELPGKVSKSVPRLRSFGNVLLGKEPTKKQSAPKHSSHKPSSRVPDWAADAVFYQIFPERFRNGDRSNDPTRESLEFPDIVPENWKVSSWTAEWYERDAWEKQLGTNFYDDGVFHRRYGGDLQGVIDKLDYLSELGINTIYFNPLFYARSLHKYDGNSFHHIDPHFGPDPQGDFRIMSTETDDPETWKWTAADKLFLKLLKYAHSRRIRIIIDGVFNHSGRDFFAFKDIVEKQEASPYVSWYMVESFDNPNTAANEFKYKGWWGVDTLPEFADNDAGNDLHPAPKSYVMTATRRWMDPNADGDPSDGIDGWRLDVANEIPDKFWRDWNAMVRQVNPQAYTVAEIWDGAGDYLKDCGFSATMNYHGFAFPVKGFLIDQKLPAAKFASLIQTRMAEHDRDVQYALQNLIDSHDTDRVASMIVNSGRKPNYLNAARFDYDVGERVSSRRDKSYRVRTPNPRERRVQQLVAIFQMTFVGAPMIYYGTEAGMDGGDDPDDRMPMYWEDLEYAPRTKGPWNELGENHPVKFDRDLFQFYKNLVKTRKSLKSLRRGSFQVVHTVDDCGLIAFERKLGDERVLVILNRSEKSCRLTFKNLGLAENEALRSVFLSSAPSEVHRLQPPVDGSVTIQNRPLDNASIKFVSDPSRTASFSAVTDSTGNFSTMGMIELPGISGGIWKIEKE